MGDQRRVYQLDKPLFINFRHYSKIVIDPHYEEKHSDTIDDQIVIKLVKQMDQEVHLPQSTDDEGFSYFVREDLELNGKSYRLIWLTHEHEIYIGVVNVYRRPKKKGRKK